MGGSRGALEIALVEIHHTSGRGCAANGGGFQDFVIQGDRQFLFWQIGTDEKMKLPPDNSRLRDGLPPQSVQQRFRRELDFNNDEPAKKPQILQAVDMDHISARQCTRRTAKSKPNGRGNPPPDTCQSRRKCGIVTRNLGRASGEMADTPDLGFEKQRFFASSFHCLNHVKPLDFTGENSLFANLPGSFEKTRKVAQKVAQIQPGG